MKGLSKKEIEVVSNLEFDKKYYFTATDIKKHFKNKKQLANTIHRLKKKGRVVRLNKSKYFLVPIKATSGKWTDHPFIIVDEIMDGQNYYIGGWSAANYWHLTEQVPMRIDVYTTKKPRKMNVLNTKIWFHKARKKTVDAAVTEKIGKHSFMIQSKEKTEKWIKSRK